MLAVQIAPLEEYPRFQHSIIGWMLAVSALLHALGFLYLQPKLSWRAATLIDAPTLIPTLKLSFRTPALPTTDSVEPPQDTLADKVTELPASSADSLAPPGQAQAEKPARPLTLELPADIPGRDTPVTAGGITENGATVMNGELLDILARAERRTGYIDNPSEPSASEYQGGSWVEYFRDGDRCFRVVLADPLEPASREMWYRVRCR